MLLAVFSDSHGDRENLRRAIVRSRPDQAVFLGDGVRDAAAVAGLFPELPFRILCGNCDWDAPDYDDSALFTAGGVRFFAAHGHRHGVKYGLEAFATSVLCAGAAIGLYGHTHRPLCSTLEGLTLLNPGSIGNQVSPTYGLIEIKNGAYDCRIVKIEEETGD